ncbi:MAG: CPBP family intramembrane metalloprotease [Planctomycetes bacterium]|nr:CPBP family intramembrane metalloprotease [Planctomycetota bacterium]
MVEPSHASWRTLWGGLLIVPLAVLIGTALQQMVLALCAGEGARAEEAFLDSTPGFAAAVLVSQVALGLAFLVVMSRVDEPWVTRLGLTRGIPGSCRGSLLAQMGCATIGVTAISAFVTAPLMQDSNAYAETIHEGVSNAGGFWVPLLVLGMAVLPACVEEFAFRGYLLRGLLRGWKPGWAIAVSSLLFAFAHLDVLYAVRLIPLAVWLGWIAWRTGSIIPSMVCHFANNFVVVAVVAGLSHLGPIDSDKPDPRLGALGLFLLGFVLYGIWSIRTVLRRLAALPRPLMRVAEARDPIDRELARLLQNEVGEDSSGRADLHDSFNDGDERTP